MAGSNDNNCDFKLWGGRFSTDVASCLKEINNSLDVDKRLYAEDICGSLAYAGILRDAKLLSEAELIAIKEGLEKVKKEWDDGTLVFKDGDEDVHTVNERRLGEIIGFAIGGKLHAGRSRNEQVVLDMKLWMRKAILELNDILVNFIKVIKKKSLENIDVIMPGYTHMQRAQPVRFSHWLMSYSMLLLDDHERLSDFYKRLDTCPLGSGALAGNPFDIDREKLAKILEFSGVTRNSMRAVSDRSFVVEFDFISTLTSLHLSRFAEDLIIFSTKEFDFVSLSEEYTTGSSLMPQKRNPDSLELIRGVSGTIFGQHTGFMLTMKGLPSTYNKDFQSDKKAMFSIFDHLKLALCLFTGIISTITVNEKKCFAALSYDMLATDLAYYLVRKGIPFREAHHISGTVVAHSETTKTPINKIPLEQLKKISPHFDASVKDIWNFEHSVEQYTCMGGTARSSVMEQIELPIFKKF